LGSTKYSSKLPQFKEMYPIRKPLLNTIEAKLLSTRFIANIEICFKKRKLIRTFPFGINQESILE